MDSREMAAATVRLLRQQYPEADCTLEYEQPWHLMVSAILAAQCTDARVNQVTPALFARYSGPKDLAAADLAELEGMIRSCGLYHNKARAIQGASRQLIEKYQGCLPDSLDDLTSLPGIGRKIANLILGDCFGIPAIVVDTHCGRISRLIGLTEKTDPSAIEQDLRRIVDSQDWIVYGHLMVSHGRTICVARRPCCAICPLRIFCRYAGNKPDQPKILSAGQPGKQS
jgi:endonuclease-3